MNPKGTIEFELRELSLMLGQYIEKEESLKEIAAIRGPQGFALGYLYKNRDRDIYQKDLEHELSIRKPTASKLVDRMKKNGFITTITSAQDKRLKQLVITEKGLRQVELFQEFLIQFEQKLRRGISEEELTQFFATLDKIKKNI